MIYPKIKGLPTKPGFYWLVTEEGRFIVYVERHIENPSKRLGWVHGAPNPRFVTEGNFGVNSSWYGPIEPPDGTDGLEVEGVR